MRYLLIGNFGVGNLGDEALKGYFLRVFPDVEWIIVSAHPKAPNEVPRLPGGVRSLLSLRWLATLSAYRTCDAVVFGGGSLFTDTESSYACFLWWMHGALARLLGKPIHLAFQGIGPCATQLGEWCTTWICRRSTSISVRDSASQKRVGDMVKNKKCILSFDPVFSLIKNKKLTISTKNVLILIPRKNSSEKFCKTAQKSLESTKWDEVRILSMQPDEKSEMQFCQNLASLLQIDSNIVMIRTLDELIQELSSAKLVISERYHGALVALALGIEVQIVSQKQGDKLDQLLLEYTGDIEARISAGYCELAKYLVQ